MSSRRLPVSAPHNLDGVASAPRRSHHFQMTVPNDDEVSRSLRVLPFFFVTQPNTCRSNAVRRCTKERSFALLHHRNVRVSIGVLQPS
jgi:hypothetical protein